MRLLTGDRPNSSTALIDAVGFANVFGILKKRLVWNMFCLCGYKLQLRSFNLVDAQEVRS